VTTAAAIGLLALIVGGLVLVNVMISTPIELVGRIFSEGSRGVRRQRFAAQTDATRATQAVLGHLQHRFGAPARADGGVATFLLAGGTPVEVRVTGTSAGASRVDVRMTGSGNAPPEADAWADVRGQVLAALRTVDPQARVVR